MSVGFEKVEPARMPGWLLRRVAPPGETRLAVTNTIRLFFWIVLPLERKAAPMSGMEPRTGTLSSMV